MSLLSTKDFADYARVKPSTLRQHIKRGKVVKNGSHIDTEQPTNVIYLQEQWANSGKPSMEPKNNFISESKPLKIESSPDNSTSNSLDWILRKKQADAIISERRAQELYLKNQKLQGKLMPVELVEKILVINIQAIFRDFESASENIASIYNEQLGGDRATLAAMSTRLREELERAINSAKEKSKDEIKSLMLEYAATRSRGEKK